jgi:hypothetical protein
MRAALIWIFGSAFVAANGHAQVPRPVTWSEVTGQSWSKLAKDRTGAVIRQVDGRYSRDSRMKIEPGERDVLVQSPARHGYQGTERHFRLRAEPCRRYYINAQFRTTTGIDWEPVVAKTEPIIGCQLPARN